MEDFLKQLPKLAADKKEENIKFFKKLKKRVPKNLDYTMQELHDEEFNRTDCLECGNCCKTTSPLFIRKDIERIAKHLRMKEHQFVSQYLKMDEDGFMVLQESPCAFLADDNYCLIYDVRPNACKEYPHTNRRKFQQISNLTITNTSICPATYRIVEAMKERIKLK